ncbi:GrpB family protein [Lysinibacillus louembei]|uniref:GrpB family protein n=1 Tax=Lysinibacillus louembei TaxID=1470088 RepID=A0ABZ0RZR9_9BACI|nr:GrpB family protein [Lysinibacillus louembei]WPK13650.1 GrpB family protein [Lysinibacillus louembei]
MRKTEIVPWTKEWDKLYMIEAEILSRIFEHEIINIFHIGSTSVQAIGYAKPIIDILIVVKNIRNIDRYNDKMLDFEYEAKGENGITGRKYFVKGKKKRTHHVHIFQIGNENINKHLQFKNYLIYHHQEAKKYGDLKIALAKKFPNNTYQYQKGKEAFMNNLVVKALEWEVK